MLDGCGGDEGAMGGMSTFFRPKFSKFHYNFSSKTVTRMFANKFFLQTCPPKVGAQENDLILGKANLRDGADGAAGDLKRRCNSVINN
jgi:hypothetical protein